jgi:threonine synthase
MVVTRDYESLFKGLRCQKCDVLYPLGTAYWIQDRGLLLSEYVRQSLAADETILAEPAAAVSITALPEALEQGFIHTGERVVCVLTGHGLKDVDPLDRSLPSMNSIASEKSEFMDAYTSMERKYCPPC